MRRSIDAVAVLTLASALVACFTDAPPSQDGTGTGGATDSTATDASTSSATHLDSSAGAEAGPTSGSTSTDPDTGGTAEVGSDGSTGATFECGCAMEAVFCEGFESDLDSWEQAVGIPPPEPSDEQAACGAQSLKAVMPSNQNTSTIAIDVPSAAVLASPFSLGGYIMIRESCKSDASIRMVRLWFDDGGMVPPEYLVELVVEGITLSLRASAEDGEVPPAVASTDLFANDTWVAFRIDFDMSEPSQPAVAASIDGAPVLAIDDAPALTTLADPHTFAVLGPRREIGEAGMDDCVVFYDEVWLAPTP